MNKQAMQLPINMIVVIILGLAMLGMGISIFYKTYNKTVDVKEKVDSQTREQLNRLLDTGEAVVIPFTSKTASRGDFVDFDIGISNELGRDGDFFVFVYFSHSEALGSDNVAMGAHSSDDGPAESCLDDVSAEPANCVDKWILMPDFGRVPPDNADNEDRFGVHIPLENNEREELPVRIVFPRKIAPNGPPQGLPSGQYIFNVDIFKNSDSASPHDQCDVNDYYPSQPDVGPTCTRYFSRKKLYVTID